VAIVKLRMAGGQPRRVRGQGAHSNPVSVDVESPNFDFSGFFLQRGQEGTDQRDGQGLNGEGNSSIGVLTWCLSCPYDLRARLRPTNPPIYRSESLGRVLQGHAGTCKYGVNQSLERHLSAVAWSSVPGTTGSSTEVSALATSGGCPTTEARLRHE
jgi:hypothetical protein